MYMGEFGNPSSKLTPCPKVSTMGSNAYILQYIPPRGLFFHPLHKAILTILFSN